MHPGPGYQDNGDRFFLEVGEGEKGSRIKEQGKGTLFILKKR